MLLYVINAIKNDLSKPVVQFTVRQNHLEGLLK